MKSESLLKALTGAGAGSRRKMADAIRNEKVFVNGQLATGFNHPVNMETDRVTINGKPVDLKPEQTVTLILNKPPGFISTVSDERGRRTVISLLPEKYRRLRLYPVGRLDKDSTGLILLTNDGELAYHLTHPKFEYEKEYLVHIDRSLRTGEKQRLERGIKLEDGMTHPAKVRKTGPSFSPFNYSITIQEGKKRQVRRMFAHLEYSILALKRIRIGNLRLGNLQPGKARELSAPEIRRLLNQA